MRNGVLLAVLSIVVSSAGCFKDTRTVRDQGVGNPFDRGAQTVKAPLKGRCEVHGESAVRAPCDEAGYLAQNYVRKLGVGDEICLEGGFGEEPGGACLARAAVVDVGTNTVLVEIRAAQPASRWYRHVMGQVWYEEGALVDLYLAERGY